MKFLTDQDVYQLTVEFLLTLGHHVTKVSKMGLARATDEEFYHTQYAIEELSDSFLVVEPGRHRIRKRDF